MRVYVAWMTERYERPNTASGLTAMRSTVANLSDFAAGVRRKC